MFITCSHMLRALKSHVTCFVVTCLMRCSGLYDLQVCFSGVYHVLSYNTSAVFHRVPTSPRGTRKKIQQTQPVTMPTGSRSLDKRTLASLVVVRHLGDADRRNM